MADNVRSEDVLGQKWDRKRLGAWDCFLRRVFSKSCLSIKAVETKMFIKHAAKHPKYSEQKLITDACADFMAQKPHGLCLGRPWPVAFGAGVGLGMGYANCQHDFQNPFLQHGQKVKVTENKQV